MTALDLKEQRMIDHFVERYEKAHKEGYRIDNSRLPAGSPMYFYCHFCGIHTLTLPEDYLVKPLTECADCTRLVEAELMPEAQKAANEGAR